MKNAEDEASQEEHEAVTDIAEHYAEKEGKRHAGEIRRVYLLVTRHTVSVDYFLERLGEGIQADMGWRLYSRVVYLFYLNLRLLVNGPRGQAVYLIQQLMLGKRRPHKAIAKVSFLL